MTDTEITKVHFWAEQFRRQKAEIQRLKCRIDMLEGKVEAISKEDAEVIALVRLHRSK